MQDYRKLRAWQLADELALETYKMTLLLPDEERFGLSSQLRRAAVAAASNIVEGSARSTQKDFAHFLDMANGSAHEVAYQLSIAHRLHYLNDDHYSRIRPLAQETCRAIYGLIKSVRR